MNDTDELPNEIFINVFPMETEENESRLYNEQSTENQELRKVTSWLTEDTSFSSNTVQRYQWKLRDGVNSSEKTTTK